MNHTRTGSARSSPASLDARTQEPGGGPARKARGHYDGTVMSVDETGALVRRRVVGWHATPLADRRVFRLTYRSAKNAGANKVSIQLTGDHPVLTEGGYVRVDELESGDRIATGVGISALARDVVCGTVLGDGMRANCENSSTSIFSDSTSPTMVVAHSLTIAFAWGGAAAKCRCRRSADN